MGRLGRSFFKLLVCIRNEALSTLYVASFFYGPLRLPHDCNNPVSLDRVFIPLTSTLKHPFCCCCLLFRIKHTKGVRAQSGDNCILKHSLPKHSRLVSITHNKIQTPPPKTANIQTLELKKKHTDLSKNVYKIK